MSRSYKDMFNNNNRDNNTSNKFKAPKNSTFDMFSINVSKAEKDTRQVFDYAKSQLTDYEKYSTASMQKVAKAYSNTYKSIYSDLANQHKSYLNDLIDRETQAANRVSKIWNSVDRTSNSNNASRSSEKLFNVNKNNSNNTNINLDTSNLDEASNSIKAAANDMGGSNLKNAKSMSAAANLISGAANVLVSGVERFLTLWIDRFFDGMDRIVNTYEDTYQTVSVLMDINQSQYAEVQSKSLDKINELNLGNNIAISNVMKELETVVKLGVTGEDAKNKAISDSITKAINPYIETTSDAYTDLQLKLGDKFVTTMNGMAQSVATTAGSTRFMQRNINDILTSMEPIVLNAKSDYADKVLGPMVQKLEAAVNSGAITAADAENIKQNIVDMQLNPYEALSSNNIAVAVSAQKATDRNVDFSDSNKLLDIFAESMDELTGNLSTDGTYNQVAKSAVNNVYGLSTSMWMNSNDFRKAIEGVNTSSSYEAGLTAQDNFANDKYTTAKQQKDISAENASLGLGQFKQQYPDAYEILSTMAATLAEISSKIVFSKIADIGANLFGKLLNKGASKVLGNTVSEGISKGIGKGILKNVGSKALNGLAKLGGGSAGAGAGVATVGGVAAGALISAGGIYHMSDAAKTLSNKSETSQNKTLAGIQMGGGATAAVGGAVGAGALLALGASNPIGWAALGIGALGLTVAQVVKSMKKTPKYVDEINEKFETAGNNIETYNKARTETVKQETENQKATIEQLISSGNIDNIKTYLKDQGKDITGKSTAELYGMLKDIRDGIKDDKTLTESENVRNTVSKEYLDVLQQDLTDKNDKISGYDGTNSEIVQQKFKDLLKDKNIDEARNLLKSLNVSDEDADKAINWWREDNNYLKDGSWNVDEITRAFDDINENGAAGFNAVMDEISGDYGLDLDHIKEIDEDKLTEIGNNIGAFVDLENQLANGNTLTESEQEELKSSIKFLTDMFGEEYIGKVKENAKNFNLANFSADGLTRQKALYESLPGGTKTASSSAGGGYTYAYSKDNKGTQESFEQVYGTDGIYSQYATGIPYVSEDETAKIHEGETVLNKEDARKYREAKASIQEVAKSYEDLDKLDTITALPGTSDSSSDSDASRSDILVAINDGINRLVEIISKSYRPNKDDQSSIINKQKLLSRNLTSSIFDDDLVNLKTTTTTRAR